MLKELAVRISQARFRAVIRSCLFGLLLVAISSPPMEAQQCSRDRAMWIQQTPYDVVRVPAERDEVFRFATAPEHPIKEFFLSVSIRCPSADRCTVDGESYQAALRLFLLEAHSRDIRVHALFGEPGYALESSSERVRAKVQAILEFNDSSETDQKFDAIHLDVEPHTLPQWRCPSEGCSEENWAVRRDILRQFLDMNARVVDQLAGQNLDYGVDLPDNWYPFVDDHGVFQEQRDFLMVYNDTQNYPTYHLMNMVKDVTFMSYRPPDTTIRRTRHAMEYAAEVGALVYIGVQTVPRSAERPWTYGAGSTFSDGTRSGMEQLLCTVDSAFAGLPSFRGFSYNKYSSYADMPEE